MKIIIKRTFEALKYPKGSEQRKTFNENSATSEYMPSHKYTAKDKHYTLSFRTKAEAEAFSSL